jgi:hypothetical protein
MFLILLLLPHKFVVVPGADAHRAQLFVPELLRSIHKESGPVWDWKGTKKSPAPVPSAQKHDRKKNAQSALETFQPTFWDKLFRNMETKRKALNDAIEDARATDAKEYLESVGRYTRLGVRKAVSD